jgi:hypothetical protein
LRLTEGLGRLERRNITSDETTISFKLIGEVSGSQVEGESGDVEDTGDEPVTRGSGTQRRGTLTFGCPARYEQSQRGKTRQLESGGLGGTYCHDHFAFLLRRDGWQLCLEKVQSSFDVDDELSSGDERRPLGGGGGTGSKPATLAKGRMARRR